LHLPPPNIPFTGSWGGGGRLGWEGFFYLMSGSETDEGVAKDEVFDELGIELETLHWDHFGWLRIIY